MPINKLFKNLLIEIVLCFTIATLAGHLSVNFWERYVVHKELCSMKDNLRHLKITVNHIGNAYDNLQNELIGLAGTKNTKRPTPRHGVKFSCNSIDVGAAKTLHNEMIKERNNDKLFKPIKKNYIETMSNSLSDINKNKVRNASTITISTNSNVKLDSDLEFSSSKYSCKLKDVNERHKSYKTCGCYFE